MKKLLVVGLLALAFGISSVDNVNARRGRRTYNDRAKQTRCIQERCGDVADNLNYYNKEIKDLKRRIQRSRHASKSRKREMRSQLKDLQIRRNHAAREYQRCVKRYCR